MIFLQTVRRSRVYDSSDVFLCFWWDWDLDSLVSCLGWFSCMPCFIVALKCEIPLHFQVSAEDRGFCAKMWNLELFVFPFILTSTSGTEKFKKKSRKNSKLCYTLLHCSKFSLCIIIHLCNLNVCNLFDSGNSHLNGLIHLFFFCPASDWGSSWLLSRPFNPSWAAPLLALYCHVNDVLSVQGTNMWRTMGGVDMHSIYASIIAFDDVNNYVALMGLCTRQINRKTLQPFTTA